MKKVIQKIISTTMFAGCFALAIVLLPRATSAAGDQSLRQITLEKENSTDTNALTWTYNLTKTSDNAYIKAGVNQDYNATIEKIDENGNREWIFENSDGNIYYAVAEAAPGEYIAVGVWPRVNRQGKALITKIKEENGSPQQVWSYNYEYHGPGSNARQTNLHDIEIDSDGNYVISGYYMGQTTGSYGQTRRPLLLKISDLADCQGTTVCSDHVLYSVATGTDTSSATSAVDKHNDTKNKVFAMGNDEYLVNAGGEYYGFQPSIGKVYADGSSPTSLGVYTNRYATTGVASAITGEYMTTWTCIQPNKLYSSLRPENSDTIKKYEAYEDTTSDFKLGSSSSFNVDNDSYQYFCPNDLIVTADDQYIIYGRTGTSNSETGDSFMQKITGSGEVIWEVRGDSDSEFVAVIDDGNGNYVAVDNKGTFYRIQDSSTVYHAIYHIVSDIKPELVNDRNDAAASMIKVNRSDALSGEDYELEDYDTFNDYIFNGWYTDPELTTKFEDLEAQANVDLYGAYSLKIFSLDFMVQRYQNDQPISDQEHHATLDFTIDDNVVMPQAPSVSGYTFDGWYLDTQGGQTIKLDPGSTVTGNNLEELKNAHTLYGKLNRDSYTVHFNISVEYSQYNDCDGYYSELINNPDETVLGGETITSLRMLSPTKACYLTDLQSQPYRYGDDYTDFDINTPITSELWVKGVYRRSYITVKNNGIYYPNGEPFDPSDAEGISWDQADNTLTLTNYHFVDIRIDDEVEEVNVVLNGENDTQIKSQSAPITITGDGLLKRTDLFPYGSHWNYSVDALGTSITIESGRLEGGPIAANDIVLNDGYIDDIVYLGPEYYDETYPGEIGELEINGGKINGYIKAKGDVVINNGIIATDSGIRIDKRMTVNGGTISTTEALEANGFIMNDGEVSVSNMVNSYFELNGGNLNVSGINVEDVEESSYTPSILVNGGYAVFNGGTAKISGLYPMTVLYFGPVSEASSESIASLCGSESYDLRSLNAELRELGFEEFASMEDCRDNFINIYSDFITAEYRRFLGDDFVLPWTGVSFNGGDVEFNVISKDELIERYVDSQMEHIINMLPEAEEGCADLSGEEEMIMILSAHYKTLRADIETKLDGNGDPMEDGDGNILVLADGIDAKLVQMLDDGGDPLAIPEMDVITGNAIVDEGGNPVFVTLYQVVDENGEVLYNQIGRSTDETGKDFYFKTAFDYDDCVSNFEDYIGLEFSYYRDYLAYEVSAGGQFDSIGITPTAIMIINQTGEPGESAIKIANQLIKEPDYLTVSTLNGGFPAINSGQEITNAKFVTFGDGEDASLSCTIEDDTYTCDAEHILTYAHIYEASTSYTITFVDADGNIIQTEEIESGETPVYTGDEPTKETTPKYQYEFIGWSPDDGTTVYPKDESLPPATDTISYTPVFDKEEYTPTSEWIENQEYTIGEDQQAVFRVDIAEKFFANKIEIDGEVATPGEAYDITEGSTIVTLIPWYLDTLAEGEHSMNVYFKADNEDEVVIATTFTAKKNAVPPVPATDGTGDITTGETGFKPAEKSSDISAATATILLAVIASSVYMIGRRVLRRK